MRGRFARPAAILAGAALFAGLVIGLPSSSAQTVAPTVTGRLESCTVDSASTCMIQHGLGVKPSAIELQMTNRVALTRIDDTLVTDSQYQVVFRRTAAGQSFTAGTLMKFFAVYTSSAAPAPTPTPTPTPGAFTCTHLGDGGCPETFAQSNCPAPDLGQSGYCYLGNSNSNGWNTYVNNDCHASAVCGSDPSTYKLEANSPGDWQTTVFEGPVGDTAVKSYPDVQQLYDYVPITSLSSLTSTYAESMPDESTGTLAQFAWDMWIDAPSGSINEIMVWVDNKNRGSGGATQVGTTTIAGQDWTIYRYGTTELIFSLGAPGTFAQQSSGTVDLRAVLQAAIDKGFIANTRKLTQVNAGWEICSTGSAARTFKVTDYTLTSG